MNTLIVPCAGKSSRFPNMRPKYLLTHPDGHLMVKKSFEQLNTDIFDRIIITVVRPHDEQYDCQLILEQCFSKNPKIEICVLDDFTKSASETVALTLEKMNVTGSIVIKDADNTVDVVLPQKIENAVVGYDLHCNPTITNIPSKSFLVINDQNIILDIIEKRVISNIICLGVYCFRDCADFMFAYSKMQNKGIAGEMFISHVISFMLAHQKNIFEYITAKSYEDWGTLSEWRNIQKNFRTLFIDVDGVLMKNCGQYGKINWHNNKELLMENIKTIRKLQESGSQIIITTSRPEALRKDLETILASNGIKPHSILMGLHHSSRVLVNDFAPTNPYPSCVAISLPRNSILNDYFDD